VRLAQAAQQIPASAQRLREVSRALLEPGLTAQEPTPERVPVAAQAARSIPLAREREQEQARAQPVRQRQEEPRQARRQEFLREHQTSEIFTTSYARGRHGISLIKLLPELPAALLHTRAEPRPVLVRREAIDGGKPCLEGMKFVEHFLEPNSAFRVLHDLDKPLATAFVLPFASTIFVFASFGSARIKRVFNARVGKMGKIAIIAQTISPLRCGGLSRR
jgi:hypothetical protein